MATFYEEQLKFMTEEKFSDWIWKALSGLYYPDKDGKKCDLYFFMTLNGIETPSEALAEIYFRYVKSDDQEMFRKAIGLALHKCVNEHKAESVQTVKVADDLIYLISQIDATEALDGLLVFLSKVPADGGYHDKLLYSCLSIMQSLDPGEEVFRFTSSLADSPSFKDGYLLGTVRILIDCRPDNALSIIDNLGARISALYNKTLQDEAEAAEYWHVVNDLFADEKEILDRVIYYSKK